MIINNYRPDLEGADFIYKRWRDSEGNLIQEHVKDFRPYFYIRRRTPDRIVKKVISRYPGSYVDNFETYTALRTGEELIRVYAHRQADLRDMAKEFGKTWEADMSLSDRYMVDEIKEMPEWKPRVWHFDLEWDPEENFTTVMSVIDSYNGRNVTFCWSEESAKEEGDEKGFVRKEIRSVDQTDDLGNRFEFDYERFFYTDEKSMHEAFLCYLEECNPDILIAHAIMWADLPHLVERLDDFRRLSPLRRVIPPPKGERGYKYTAQPIIGRLCFDTAAPLDSGTGFERVWKDSGKPQLASRKLDHITGPDVLGYGGKMEMDVFTGWYERFDEYCDYCMHDTRLLKRMDEENHILNFYLSLQQLCGVSFSSCHNVTRFARGLLGRRTEWKAPTRPDTEQRDYEGAFIPPPKPGRYEGVACVDYKGLYPSLILSHNLSWETQVDPARAGEPGIHKLPDGTCWDQTKDGLLPGIVREMFALRDGYKKKMREADTKIERDGWNTMQLAVKRVMASFYGMTASAHWGWADFDIANAITACGRQAIKFLMEESQNQGYEAIYGHTDSAFVKVPFDEAKALADHLTKEVQIQLNAHSLFVEFEAYMPYWLVAGKNLYYGICSWPPEDEGKPKSARFGKISTLAPISRNLERDVLGMVCEGASEGDVIDYVRPIALQIQKGKADIKSITGITRIQKPLHKYAESVGVPGVKGARHYNECIAPKYNQPEYNEGDSVPWVYVDGVPEWSKPTDIVAYREPEELEGFSLDWEKMTDRLIKRKIKPIFEALQWNLEIASGAARPKRYW
tara:strand:+ start:5012 stop:7393 length:2382 start_codon:yes stop_codon:yes gene_type:complete